MKIPIRIAVIDLGTNTFHLLIVENNNDVVTTLYKEKSAVKVGEGGLENDLITDTALLRAIEALKSFQTQIEFYKATEVRVIATSAFRSATNKEAVLQRIFTETGFDIQVITGNLEAQLIYEGVHRAVQLNDEKALIMDIGGGSVEFIICDDTKVYWKESFEVGGQRLMSRFHRHDPIDKDDFIAMMDYLDVQLASLKEALLTYNPTLLIGASGTFDTLVEIYHRKNEMDFSLESHTEYELPLTVFHKLNEEIISKDRDGRLAIPGMVEMRANMIVVACALIEFVCSCFDVRILKSSTYALKEGVIYRVIRKEAIV